MHTNDPLVSVIMPVYNCEKYVAQAIESVIAQTYGNWELLIVDDGSTDGSISILESCQKNDPRIRLLRNETDEHGPGAARNYGIRHISGKYTYFLDADDWIQKDLLQDTVALAESTGADLVPFGFLIEENGKTIKMPLSPRGNFVFSDFKAAANEIVRGTWAECHELIRSTLLRDVRHNPYRTGEDICFQMDLMCRAQKVCGIDREYYHYRVVENSLSHTGKWSDDFAEISLAIWEKEKQFLTYCGITDDSQTMKNTAIERYTGCIFLLCAKTCPLKPAEKYRQIRYIADRMQIRKFKKQYDCSGYSGIRRIAKLLVKYSMERMMLALGTVYCRFFA